MASLADSLALVAPALPKELVGDPERAALFAAAAALPPVHRAGFECRLAAGERSVDLQQGLFLGPPRQRDLRSLLADAGLTDGPWRRIGALAERWQTDEDPVHGAVSELWLELDLNGTAGLPTPSVFAVLSSGDAAGAILDTLLGPEQATAQKAVVRGLVDGCPEPAHVTHIGLMLGRPEAALRVHVSPIPLHRLGAYLSQLPFAGDRQEALATARTLLDHADTLVVCLDVLDGAVARIGLECFFDQRHGIDPRWRPLLDKLVELGLCTASKADGLLAWPGEVTPLDAPAAWPDDLIVDSLTRPASALGVIDRRLSHVKLTCAPGVATTAKAYFGFGHVWADASAKPEPPRRRPTPTRPAPSRVAAVAAAVQHLLASRNQAGWWRDFYDRARPADAGQRVVGYASDEWVTAFVANTLASLDADGARAAARDALDLLLHRRAHPGWGYHALLPADADTTTWVLRLADALGEPERGRLAQGREFVDTLTGEDGGVATYPESAAAQLASFLQMEGSYAGWCAAHTCVSAAAAALSERPRDYLRRTQRLDGSWRGHWWDDDEYTTARAVEALTSAGDANDRAGLTAAVRWCAARIDGAGAVRASPFATALALHAITTAGAGDERAHSAAARAERWLLDHQLEDGSWEPSARLRVPPPDAVDPLSAPERTLTYVDDDGAFTTATVVAALAARPCSRTGPA